MIRLRENPADANAAGQASRLLPGMLAEVSAMIGEELSLTRTQASELAHAVDLYLDERGSRTGASSESTFSVAVLASRALEGLGEGDVARRLLVHGTGLLRPALWNVSRGRAMWILDLRFLILSAEAPLELTLFACMETVLTASSDIWDACRGEGLLGLRHVRRTVAGLLNRGDRSRAARRLAGELRDVARQQLARIATRRGWLRVPDVINLDS